MNNESQFTLSFLIVYLCTLIRVSWAASGSLLEFPLYDFDDYDDNWGAFKSQQGINLKKAVMLTATCRFFTTVKPQ